ncbi:uncharacterized protein LOC112007446 [Quercus suber]|uniref:uncharacterized protein LOC112007446 n=1 Tax=Quercus suber TaxID=58331 RepID=UPI000CE21B5B|nr:uncharacterized protein LOC112007446 [Quercus suber]
MDAMSHALRRAVWSLFSTDIKRDPMLDKFTRPPFNSYDGKTDPVEHVNHYIQMIRVPQPVDALLSMKMRVGETLRSYASRYWELYNEISGGNEKIAASTFRMGLLEDSGLRESLTKKPPEDMRQLMRRIEEYKRLEDDQIQSKGKAPIINHPWSSVFQPRTQGNLRIQEPEAPIGEVNVTFKEPVHKIVDEIKLEPYFRAGYLKEFVLDARDRGSGQGATQRGNPLPPPLGIIEAIHAPPRSLVSARKKRLLNVVSVEGSLGTPLAGKKMKLTREPISFGDNDLEGTVQSHDDTLVVTARIGGFLVKRVMIDQGSGADVMYPDLYRGLRLKNGDLSKYSTPLVAFDGQIVIPKGQISMLVNMEGKEVVVMFIVVSFFSLYTAILSRLWIHAMGAVPSTLHVKVKFLTECGITVVRGSQQTARQCLIAMINQKKDTNDWGECAQQEELSQGVPL